MGKGVSHRAIGINLRFAYPTLTLIISLIYEVKIAIMVGMITICIEDIQRDLLGYLRQVEAGETVVVLRADQPIAEIKPIASSARVLRPFGLCAGEFTVPDDFDAPLPEDLLRQFEAA